MVAQNSRKSRRGKGSVAKTACPQACGSFAIEALDVARLGDHGEIGLRLATVAGRQVAVFAAGGRERRRWSRPKRRLRHTPAVAARVRLINGRHRRVLQAAGVGDRAASGHKKDIGNRHQLGCVQHAHRDAL